jgi:hypothetical protein
LADCRNKYRAETSGVATLNLPALQHCTAGGIGNNAAVAVVTSIQLGINQFETDY